MNPLKVTGKFLDQPILVEKVRSSVPVVLTLGAAAYTGREINKVSEDRRKKTAISTISTMAFTVASALAAPKIAYKMFKKTDEIPKNLKNIQSHSSKLIMNYFSGHKVDEITARRLEKAKSKVLNFKEVRGLFKVFEKDKDGTALLNKLIPNPENITSKEIFSEIGRLSLLGFIPVAGGIAGGITGDILTDKNWKQKIPDKIKEGAYQYLANIFLCNVGAGAALGIMEKFNVRLKVYRALGMICGILITGVFGGSAIANIISKKVINPMFKNRQKNEISYKGLFDERHPEA